MPTPKLEAELIRLYPALSFKKVYDDGSVEILNEPLPPRQQHEGGGALIAIAVGAVWLIVGVVFWLSHV